MKNLLATTFFPALFAVCLFSSCMPSDCVMCQDAGTFAQELCEDNYASAAEYRDAVNSYKALGYTCN